MKIPEGISVVGMFEKWPRGFLSSHFTGHIDECLTFRLVSVSVSVLSVTSPLNPFAGHAALVRLCVDMALEPSALASSGSVEFHFK